MTIHHATAKKAAEAKLDLTETEAGYRAYDSQAGRVTLGPDPKRVVAVALLNRTLGLEYPAVWLRFEGNEVAVSYVDAENAYPGETVHMSPTAPTLAEILELVEEAGYDPEAEVPEAETDEAPSSVVPVRYRQEYAAAGHPSHSGDWFAFFTEARFTKSVDNKRVFDPETFLVFLNLNDLTITPKTEALMYSEARGAIGRFRMNAGQSARFQISQRGLRELHLPDGSIRVVTDGEMEVLRARYPLKTKKTKKAKKAETAD